MAQRSSFKTAGHRRLNKGEAHNALARAVCFNRLGEIRDRSFENQRHRASGLNLLVAAITLWNTVYLERAAELLARSSVFDPALLGHVSPLGWEHVNLTGDYTWHSNKNKGKKSYQPILTFIAETHEYIGGELRNGDRPDGKQIARHLRSVIAALPKSIQKIFARADSGFYCSEAVQAYQKAKAHFIIVARKTSRLLEQLQTADWKPSPKTDADEQCEFRYQPEGWGQAYRFVALRYRKKEEKNPPEREQYQLVDTPEYTYRVFVTDMDRAIDLLIWFYSQRAGAENLIKEANNDAGLAAHPSRRWATNCVHFQLVMLAYNLNCWLLLFQREEGVAVDNLEHTRLATARLRFLFVAAKIWKHSGRVGISYSDQYAERGLFQRLMKRLREITNGPAGFLPVLATPLSG